MIGSYMARGAILTLNDWIGREDLRSDIVDVGMVHRWCATFDRLLPSSTDVPQGIHWCLGLPDAATQDLGCDGHPRRDDSPQSFLPPISLPRRMWASSKVDFIRSLRAGDIVERTSRINSIHEKDGASGKLVFVDVVHETKNQDSLCLSEIQSIVYREAMPQGSPKIPPSVGDERFDPTSWQQHRMVLPTPPLLFRYSALTFNSHRIHYDCPYATEEEGYRGLVVHGPLTATLLLDLARRTYGDNCLSSFSFRGLSPAIVSEPLYLVLRESGAGIELGAFTQDGRPVMSATAGLV